MARVANIVDPSAGSREADHLDLLRARRDGRVGRPDALDVDPVRAVGVGQGRVAEIHVVRRDPIAETGQLRLRRHQRDLVGRSRGVEPGGGQLCGDGVVRAAFPLVHANIMRIQPDEHRLVGGRSRVRAAVDHRLQAHLLLGAGQRVVQGQVVGAGDRGGAGVRVELRVEPVVGVIRPVVEAAVVEVFLDVQGLSDLGEKRLRAGLRDGTRPRSAGCRFRRE